MVKGNFMISNVTLLATKHNLFHSYFIMHIFQELVLFVTIGTPFPSLL